MPGRRFFIIYNSLFCKTEFCFSIKKSKLFCFWQKKVYFLPRTARPQEPSQSAESNSCHSPTIAASKLAQDRVWKV